MIRSLVTVAVTLGIVFYVLSLIATDKSEGHYATWQEALLYEVTPDRPLTLQVPADSERLVLDLVAVIDPPRLYDARQTYPFEFDVEVVTDTGRHRRWTLWAAPRVSLSEFPPQPNSKRGTKLLDKTVWGTDSTERMVHFGDLFVRTAGRVTITPHAGRVSTILARVFAERRNLLALGEMRGRRLPREERRDLGQLGAGLGFSDVAPDTLMQAVSTYRMRLDTVGKRGRDYLLRRVLMSTYRASEAEEVAKPLFFVSPDLWGAFNFDGGAQLTFEGPPRGTLLWGLGPNSEPSHVLGLDTEGKGTLDLDLLRPVTFVLSSPKSVAVSLSVSEPTLAHLVSDGRQILSHGTTRYMLPDYRRYPWTILREDKLACFELGSFEGQKRVLLALQGTGEPGTHIDHVFYQTLPTGKPRKIRAQIPLSKFELWIDGQQSTDTYYKRLNIKSGAERVCVRGPGTYLTRAYAEDESVPGDVYEVPYDRYAGMGYIMINAPRKIRRWVPLAPEDAEGTLLGEDSTRMLVAQVRIEQSELALATPAGVARTERVKVARIKTKLKRARREGIRLLVPEGGVHAQRVFVTTPRRPGLLRRDLWTEFTSGRSISVVDTEQVALAFRTPKELLPVEVELLVDGKARLTRQLRVPVEAVSLALEQGTPRLALKAPAGVRAFARAAAADFNTLSVERLGYELPSGGKLTYRVDVRRGEDLGIAFEAFSEHAFVPYRLHVSVKGRLPETWVGITNDHPAVRFWDRDFSAKGGYWQGTIDLPVPGEASTMEIVFDSKERERVFVRAVLLGQKPEGRGSAISISRHREEP